MENKNFTISVQVDQPPKDVFDAVNNVRGWWSEQVEGTTDSLNAVFDYHYHDIHICKIKIVEFVPDKKVVWLVLENYFNFTKDKTEWKDTRISFEIFKNADKTELIFSHIGLAHGYECYEICSDAWSNYIKGSLRNLIEAGKGNPNPYEAAIKSAESMKTENEK